MADVSSGPIMLSALAFFKAQSASSLRGDDTGVGDTSMGTCMMGLCCLEPSPLPLPLPSEELDLDF